MRRALIALLLAALPCAALADVEVLMKESLALSGLQQYEEALEKLEQAKKEEPGNDDITLLIARIHGWQGDYDRAERELNGIIARHPSYKDAHEVLAWVKRARTAPKPQAWQVDAGYQFSGFERRDQANWNQQFVQVNRRLDATVLHGRVERFDQFGNTDTAYELGADHSFSPRVNGYLLANISPGADFRPRWRVAAGGALRLNEIEPANIPLWATLDARHDAYADVSVRNINPGLRMEFAEDWALSPRLIAVHELGEDTVYGWMLRLDGRITSGWRFNMGYADAPETVAGSTVDTETLFGGLAIDLREDTTLHLGYSRDDRQRSYIRHVFDASISHRF